MYFHVSYIGDDTSNNAIEEDNVDEIFDDFLGMEMDWYKRDNQDNSNEDGMEKNADIGGNDILDRALAIHLPMEPKIMKMISLMMIKSRVGTTRLNVFWIMSTRCLRSLSKN